MNGERYGPVGWLQQQLSRLDHCCNVKWCQGSCGFCSTSLLFSTNQNRTGRDEYTAKSYLTSSARLKDALVYRGTGQTVAAVVPEQSRRTCLLLWTAVCMVAATRRVNPVTKKCHLSQGVKNFAEEQPTSFSPFFMVLYLLSESLRHNKNEFSEPSNLHK